jgi:hypothetical protein
MKHKLLDGEVAYANFVIEHYECNVFVLHVEIDDGKILYVNGYVG